MADIDTDRWSVLEPLVDQALETPETEWDAWLDDLAGRSPETVAMLRDLLAVRRQPGFGRFLTGSTAPRLLDLTRDALTGTQVGAYVLESELGRGGMGTVWLARRADGQYEGRAAIKLLRLAAAGGEGAERFRREARLLARLNHPCIARLLDAGIVDSTQPYLVLEYVEGERLDEYCRRLGLDAHARVELMLDVIAAVAHAHGHLVLHRDIKPANILVTPQGGVKLLDFGIGSLLGDEAEAAREQSEAQALTPEFAAPEQLHGGQVTTATDVYALGLVLRWLLTGQSPNRDRDAIVAKALETAPGERYASAAALGDDLRRYLRHEPVTARADSLRYRAGKFIRRHRSAVVATSFAALALIAITAFAIQQAMEAAGQRDEARAQTQRAEAFNAVVTSLLSQVGPGGRALTPEELLDRAVKHVEARYANDAHFLVDMLLRLSGRYFDLGRTNKEYDVLVKAESVARRSGDPALLLQVHCNSVETELAVGRKAQAKARVAEMRRLSPLVPRMPTLDRAACLRAEAELARTEDDLPATLRHLESARRVLEADGRTQGNVYGGIISMLGVYSGVAGYPAKSYEYDLLGVETDRRLGIEDSLPGLIQRTNLAGAVYDLGQVQRGVAMYREVIPGELPEKLMGIRYGEMLARAGKPDEGLRVIDDALVEADGTGNEGRIIRVRLAKATVLASMGRFDEAERWLDEAVRRMSGDELTNRIRLAGASRLRAEIALGRRRHADAAQAIAAALERLRYPREEQNLHIARALLVDARVRFAVGDVAGAIKAARDAAVAFEALTLDPEQSADLGEALLVVARAQHASGDKAGARRSAARAAKTLANGLGADQPLSREAAALAAQLDQR